MDDFTSNILNDSKNEWSILLVNLVTSHIIDGFRSIFNEAIQLCQTNDEPDKYLMTFQNLLSRIPNWNQSIINTEKERIVNKSKCSYLEDLITCVHIIQLKLLSCVRVGSENKKINVDIPDFTLFLHKIYINIARKLYSNIYLFEIDIPPLEQQRRNREFELLVQTSIMNTIRDNLPVEHLLRQYIDETQEVDVNKVETVIENKPLVEEPKVEEPKPSNDVMKLDDEPKPPDDVIKLDDDVIKLDDDVIKLDDDVIKLDDEFKPPKDEVKLGDDDLFSEKKNTISFHPSVTDNDIKIGGEIKLDVEELEPIDLGIEEL